MTCPHCAKTVLRCEYTKKHLEKCPGVQEACPRACGKTPRRDEMKLHEKQCPLVLVKCPVCGKKVPRGESKDHIEICRKKLVAQQEKEESAPKGWAGQVARHPVCNGYCWHRTYATAAAAAVKPRSRPKPGRRKKGGPSSIKRPDATDWLPPDLVADEQIFNSLLSTERGSREDMGASWMGMVPTHVHWRGFTDEEMARANKAENSQWFPLPNMPDQQVGNAISQEPPEHMFTQRVPRTEKPKRPGRSIIDKVMSMEPIEIEEGERSKPKHYNAVELIHGAEGHVKRLASSRQHKEEIIQHEQAALHPLGLSADSENDSADESQS